MPAFLNYLQELYNSLAVLFSEYENNDKAICYAEKAERVYHQIHSMGKTTDRFGSNLFRHLKAQTLEPETKKFQHCFYFEGGIHHVKTEKLYTHTLFYKAQILTKIGLKKQAAEYCGLTMKRQYEMNDYEIRDWCYNCINLSEYYTENGYFA